MRLILLLFLTSCTTIPLPPAELQHGAIATVEFSDNAKDRCAALGAPKGAIACANDALVVVPNPCKEKGTYADILCHELGHKNQDVRNHEGYRP